MAIKRNMHRIMIISKVQKIADYLREVLPAEMCREMVCVSGVG